MTDDLEQHIVNGRIEYAIEALRIERAALVEARQEADVAAMLANAWSTLAHEQAADLAAAVAALAEVTKAANELRPAAEDALRWLAPSGHGKKLPPYNTYAETWDALRTALTNLMAAASSTTPRTAKGA